jgi:hypothetical protein
LTPPPPSRGLCVGMMCHVWPQRQNGRKKVDSMFLFCFKVSSSLHSNVWPFIELPPCPTLPSRHKDRRLASRVARCWLLYHCIETWRAFRQFYHFYEMYHAFVVEP